MTPPLCTATLSGTDRKHLADVFRTGQVRSVQALPSASAAYLGWLLWESFREPMMLVTDGPNTQDQLFEDLQTLRLGRDAQVAFYPAWESIPTPESPPQTDLTGDRISTLQTFLQGSPPAITVTTAQALMQRTASPDQIREAHLSLETNAPCPLEKVAATLVEAGFDMQPEVYTKSQMSRRGGLIDVWPTTSDWPLRIEWFGDTIESIRTFDPNDQRSIDQQQCVDIGPAREPKPQGALFDFLPASIAWIIVDPGLVDHHAQVYEESMVEADAMHLLLPYHICKQHMGKDGQLLVGPDEPDIKQHRELAVTELDGVSATAAAVLTPDALELARDEFLNTLKQSIAEDFDVTLFFGTSGIRDRFAESRADDQAFMRAVHLKVGRLSSGFADQNRKLVAVAESDLFGQRKALRGRYHLHAKRKGPARQSVGQRIQEWTDLRQGEYVVHVEHGIGRYLGLSPVTIRGKRQDALTIEYANKAKLHVPVTHVHLLTRYVGTGQRTPSLHRLGSRRWQREKDAASKSVEDLAAAMLDTQAARETEAGFACAPDSTWQTEFEASFPFQETPDQEQAIADIKQDMERSQPMDRLICGDVGYGKTELAMRAAFKTVMNGKQVGMLVPTTILAQQHRESFLQRMAAFPVTIGMLSRFQTKGEQRLILDGVRSGAVDIVIGTHRLIQPDVKFHDLGLVIIDEEQRFGVEQKEHLKQLRRMVDVLTMTATPIPRTLYMSLLGARDMSTIQTPPQERLPVETHVASFDKALIRTAILREINREGQVFFLHNRVLTIDRMHQRLQLWVPEARIAVAHGQMNEKELAMVMRLFVLGEYDVLLCTTIIESGVDIPNVNTIIIDRADRFGLAELYQLRGRVGRYKHRAYAYLLTPSHGAMANDARERISALKRHSQLGSGFKIALKDLEIRGAGNLLGSEQSGHIAAVGFELYCQLLKRTVAARRGEALPPLVTVELKLDFVSQDSMSDLAENTAFIPRTYIEDEMLRVQAYRRLASCSSEQDLRDLRQEWHDRFGPVPDPVHRLSMVTHTRFLAARLGITTVETRDDKLMLSRDDDFIKNGRLFPRLTQEDTTEKLGEIVAHLKTLSQKS